MKKIILPMFALTATAMLLPSCSSDDIDIQTGDATVTLSATLPDGLQTRTFGDGYTAKHLQMVVLDGDTKLPVFAGEKDVYSAMFADNSLTADVNVRLASGKTYTVICWADAAEGSPYEFSTTDYTVKATYGENCMVNDDRLDAFYAAETFTVKGDGTQTIEMRRPFAQLNIGADDIKAANTAGFEATEAKVALPVYTGLDLRNGNVTDRKYVNFNYNTVRPDGETFPVAGYEYLTMNYFLTGADKELVEDVKLTVRGNGGSEIERTFNSVPVQRNYRTNIFGSLLTSSQNFNVVIEPDFDGAYIHLTEDMTADKTMVIRGKGNILDLNGKTYSASGPIADFSNGDKWSMFSVRGELTVSGNGTVKPFNQVGDAFSFDVQEGGKLIIEDGNFYGNDHVVYVFSGEAEIRGGRFEQLTNSTDWVKDYVLNCYDDNYKNGTAKITVLGGEFINFNPADCNAEGAHTNFVAEGYVSVKVPSTDGKDHFVVKKAGFYNDYSEVFGTTIDYVLALKNVHLQPAADAADSRITMAAGGEIRGTDTSSVFYFGTTSGKAQNCTVSGQDGVISATSSSSWRPSLFNMSCGSALTIEGNNTYVSQGPVFCMRESTVTVKGGHFNTTDTRSDSGLFEIGYMYGTKELKVYIQGGVFEYSNQLVYNDPANKKAKVAFEISGGIFVGSQPDAKYLKSGYKFNQTTYNGKTAFEVVPA